MRKWLVRSLVFTMLVAMVSVPVLYDRYTNPDAMRAQVIEHLATQFPGAEVTLEGARLRFLGGVLLTDLRLIRRDDPRRTVLLYVPSAIVYHDKEQLLDGTLAIRKIELHRPRLRLVRRPDKSWNVMGLVKETGDPSQPMPAVLIHGGTVVFDDRSLTPPMPPIELAGVTLTMLPESPSQFRFEGKAESEQFGKIDVHADWFRDTGQMELWLNTVDGLLTPTRLQRLLAAYPHPELRALDLRGKFDVALHVNYLPAQPAVHYDFKWKLKDGTCSHPKLPMPLEQVECEVYLDNNKLRVTELSAKSGKMQLHADLDGQWPALDKNFRASLHLEHLHICPTLCNRMPADVKLIHQLFQPHGPTAMSLEFACKDGKWQSQRCVLRPQQVAINFEHFPYPVKGLTGVLDIDLLKDTTRIDLQAKDAGKELRLTGMWQGRDDETTVDLKLEARKIPLDKTIIAALPDVSRDLAVSFHPTSGYADVQANIRYQPGWSDYCNEYKIQFFDTTVKWDQFPYELSQVSGELNLYPDYWEFNNFRATHGQGKVFVQGRALPINKKNGETTNFRILLDIGGKNIAIDKSLRTALAPMPPMIKVWDTLTPTGQLSFQTHVDHVPGRHHDMNVSIDVHGCSLEPAFYRYPLHDVSGHFHFHKNRLVATKLRARHNSTRFSIKKGTVDISPTGGWYADFIDVVGSPVWPGDGFLAALPEKLQAAVNFVDQKRPLAMKARIIVAQKPEPGSVPDVWWDGMVWLDKAKLKLGLEVDNATGVLGCVGRHDGQKLLGLKGHMYLQKATVYKQPFTHVHAKFLVKKKTPNVMQIDLNAPIFGGDISGQMRVDLQDDPRYEMNLTASQIDLARFGRHNLGAKSQISGLASARLHLTGRGASMKSLDGNGLVAVPEGKLLNLPWLLDLLKFLGLRWPDRTAFERAHAGFSIRGPTLKIDRLDLWGNAISVTGNGQLNLDGTGVKLDFYPSWARVEQVLPQVLKPLPPALSKTLLKIEARGKISNKADDLKFYKRPVPIIVEPLQYLRDRVIENTEYPSTILKRFTTGGR